ncbi:MAG: UDP-N-acetylmuramoyl-L-alanine--D-glutamate ligase [Acidimicrobiia bacterium]|nr:UDP-N-acetylmuramoyl-L-alanine--D-glutamate ligase [Acidimicrobiia bacterium]
MEMQRGRARTSGTAERNRPEKGTRVVVVGLAVTGDALVRHLTRRGDNVIVLEDTPGTGPEYAARAQRARAAGADVVERPGAVRAGSLAAVADLVVPSPGVSERHAAIAAALRAKVPVRSEVDVAAEVASRNGGPVLAAITGTNAKTTVTTLTAAMLMAAGVKAVPAGNIGRPLIEAVEDAVDVVVAEVSSFQLNFTTDAFRPRASALLNLGADHLDWHRTFDAYARAKSKVFAHQSGEDLLVFNADDPVVAGLAAEARGRRVPFSVAQGAASGYRVLDTAAGQVLVTSDDEEIVALEALPRRTPSDVANALAASAMAVDLGADLVSIGDTLTGFTGLAHRLQLVTERNEVRYVDDSKATNVHATIAAVGALESVVLLAGGRNKGLDLGELRTLAPRLRAVVAIGEAADEVAEAFAGLTTVVAAASMREAVRKAHDLAERGDTVLLSPACASFDWYPSYSARGDDFAREVRELVEVDG